MKEITLAKLLENGPITIRVWPGGHSAAGLRSVCHTQGSPEDALQSLAVSLCGSDTLLDIGRSRKWEQVHGPDGVAGLNDGEAGIVICRDGALHLVEKVPCRSTGEAWIDTADTTRPCETSREEEGEATCQSSQQN